LAENLSLEGTSQLERPLGASIVSGNQLTYSPCQTGELGLCRGDDRPVVIRKADKENRERSKLKSVQGRMAKVLFPSSVWYIDEQDKGPTLWEATGQNEVNPGRPVL
jgi:hypothetical protein